MPTLARVLALAVLVLCITGTAAAMTSQVVIQPTGNQDGTVYGGIVDVTSPYGHFGLFGGSQIGTVSILTLPEGVTADMVISATLTVPQPDYVMQNAQAGYPQGYNFDLVHVDATNGTIVRLSDIDLERELGVIGVFRAAGPIAANNSRIMSYNVTAQVKVDMNDERASFAFKTKTSPYSNPAHTLDYFMFPTVENNQGFPQAGAKLTIEVEYPQWRYADINEDLEVNMEDLATLGQWWGWQYSEPMPQSTPPQSDWRWEKAETYAPSPSLFENRGTATVEFGAQYAAPGAPADVAHLYGVIKYRDNIDNLRDYDLFFSPTLVIWKLWRYDVMEVPASRASFAFKTKTDPSISAHTLNYFMFPTVENTQGFPQQGAKLTIELTSPTQTVVIRPTGNQDAAVRGGIVDLTSPYGHFGIFSGNQIGTVSIFTLPVGVAPGRVVSATLTVPQPDYVMQNVDAGYPQGYNFNLVHIDAVNDTTVTADDLTAGRELGVIGVFRAAGPVVPNTSRIMTYNVTAQVKADMTVDTDIERTHAQYVGGFHYATCTDGRDGEVTAMDRSLMPTIGLHGNWMVEPGSGATENLGVRTNSGCGTGTTISEPYPINVYCSSGSVSGEIPPIIAIPTWTPATQTLHSISLSLPWTHYPGVLDPLNSRFIEDFTSYDAATKTLIQEQIAAAENNVQLENQIRILPDGTIMWTWTWTDLKAGPWIPYALDGLWLTPDSTPNGEVWYYNDANSSYVEPFANTDVAMYITTDWVGYFIDNLRPNLGIGFYFDKAAGDISIHTAEMLFFDCPSVLHSDYWTAVQNFGVAFRQMFMSIGNTKEEMQAKSLILENYCQVETFERTIPSSSPADINGDQTVDMQDMAVIAEYWLSM